jgi:putative secretion ATPase (PEP-CTERM system associated)
MYTGYYKLTGRPFQLSPDHRFYFDSRSHKKALAYLIYGLNQGEGFIVVTGDIGAGKTTLVGHLLDQLDPAKFVAANVVTTQLAAGDMLRVVAAAFGLSQEGADKATVLKRIESFLIECHKSGKRALLLIDEVQNVPIDALEELRMLSNFQFQDTPLLQSFLIGQPQFKQIIADPNLEQLRQRVIATYHLEPMDIAETRSYVEHRLKKVGWNHDPMFNDDAFRAIFEHTGGVPRRINTLCSRLMLFGYLEELHQIDAAVVEEVVKDLVAEGAHTDGRAHDALAGQEEALAPATAGANGGLGGGNGAAAPAVRSAEQLEKRVAILEEYVRAHDKTISRALDIAAQWLETHDDAGVE